MFAWSHFHTGPAGRTGILAAPGKEFRLKLKNFARLTPDKIHGGHYFLLKDGTLIGGFTHKHILAKVFDVEIGDGKSARIYQTRFHAEACAIRVLFEEEGRLVTEFPDCATKAQAKSIAALQRRVALALKSREKPPDRKQSGSPRTPNRGRKRW
jgi:hypothetical protein